MTASIEPDNVALTTIRKDFANKFSQIGGNFEEPVEFLDAVGFSICKSYRNGFSSLYKFSINNHELKQPNSKKALIISATYGKIEEQALTVTSERSLTDPANLESRDEFYFDVTSKKFYSKMREVGAREILEVVEMWHTKPTKRLRGFWLRVKLFFWKYAAISFLNVITKLLKHSLFLFFGIKVDLPTNDPMVQAYFAQDKNRITVPTKEVTGKKVPLFGYEVQVWSMISYCTIHLTAYTCLFILAIRPDYILTILNNTFLTSIYVITSLWVFEVLLPKTLEYTLKKTYATMRIVSQKKVRI